MEFLVKLLHSNRQIDREFFSELDIVSKEAIDAAWKNGNQKIFVNVISKNISNLLNSAEKLPIAFNILSSIYYSGHFADFETGCVSWLNLLVVRCEKHPQADQLAAALSVSLFAKTVDALQKQCNSVWAPKLFSATVKFLTNSSNELTFELSECIVKLLHHFASVSKPHRRALEDHLAARLAETLRNDHQFCIEILEELFLLEPLIFTKVFGTIDFVFHLLFTNSSGTTKDRYSLAINMQDLALSNVMKQLEPFFTLAKEMLQPTVSTTIFPNILFDFCEKCFSHDIEQLDVAQKIVMNEFYSFAIELLKLVGPSTICGMVEHQQRIRILIIKSLTIMGYSSSLRSQVLELVILGLDLNLFDDSQYTSLIDVVLGSDDISLLYGFLLDSKNEVGLDKLYDLAKSYQVISSIKSLLPGQNADMLAARLWQTIQALDSWQGTMVFEKEKLVHSIKIREACHQFLINYKALIHPVVPVTIKTVTVTVNEEVDQRFGNEFTESKQNYESFDHGKSTVEDRPESPIEKVLEPITFSAPVYEKESIDPVPEKIEFIAPIENMKEETIDFVAPVQITEKVIESECEEMDFEMPDINTEDYGPDSD